MKKIKKVKKKHLPPPPRKFINLINELDNPSPELYKDAVNSKRLPFALRARIINTYERVNSRT